MNGYLKLDTSYMVGVNQITTGGEQNPNQVL